MKTKLYIIGAGSVGGHIAHNIQGYGSRYEIAGLLDDDPDKIGKEMFGYSVIGPVDEALLLENVHVAVGIAFPKIKKTIVQKLSKNKTLIYPTLVHEKAWVSGGVLIGKGSVIYPGTCINYGSEIGDYVVMNMNCALGHHTVVGNYTSFAPGVQTGGHTHIGEVADLGIGTSTVQHITIGQGAVTGGQSMIIEDVKSRATVVGVPARTI